VKTQWILCETKKVALGYTKLAQLVPNIGRVTPRFFNS